MTSILGWVYQTPGFLLGYAAAIGLQHLIWRQQRLYLDKHHALPDGARRPVRRISRTWWATMVALFGLGYVMFSVNTTHDQTVSLAKDVARCQQESYQATNAQIKLNADNDLISRTQQNLQREFDVDTSNWLKDLIAHPGDTNYAISATTAYQDQLNDLGRRFDYQVHRRQVLDEQRQQNPLPEVTCGK